MMNPTFEQNADNARSLIRSGTIHPGALVDLAKRRLMRLHEMGDFATDTHYRAAYEVLEEGRELCEDFNRARA